MYQNEKGNNTDAMGRELQRGHIEVVGNSKVEQQFLRPQDPEQAVLELPLVSGLKIA